jgi:hypothetical protein
MAGGMSAAPAATVTPAMVRALIDEAKRKNYAHGVLGFRAPVQGLEPQTFQHDGQPVSLVPCVSALAARAALLERPADGWLVLVTDRNDDDLGAGLLAHLVGQRLRSPDAWQAVQQRFAATGIDTQLAGGPRHRDIAAGLLEATPPEGWPPAPAGLLSRDHAYGAVARRWLDVPDGPLDLLGVLDWSTNRTPTARIGDLRRLAGDALTDAVLDWIAGSTGPAEPVVARLVAGGAVSDLLPLGLVLDPLLGDPTTDAALVIARLQHRWGTVSPNALSALAAGATAVAGDLVADPRRRDDVARVLARADEFAREGQGEPLMIRSAVLRSGLVQRLRRLGDELRRDPAERLPAIESAWALVAEHRLRSLEGSVPALLAAVRLVRWLASAASEDAPKGLAALARRQADVDAWVDSAVNDATTGVDDERVAAALEDVLRRVRLVRDEHDWEFAQALAEASAGPSASGRLGDVDAPVWLMENVLADVVAGVARTQPTLLLVLDGLSTGVATEVVADIDQRTDVAMTEALLPGLRRRGAALAVLPSITDASRTSLLCGQLITGQQSTELAGYQRLVSGLGLGESPLFHKRILDTSRPGFAVSDEVKTAIADVSTKLVTCVLNTIDDALDRSDPGGTDWTADTVKHLVPLLQRAREAGRAVVITSDHGHVVERRAGVQRSYPGGANTRYRADVGEIGDDEVLVSGPRVLTPDHRAVLAVSERLRYGPLKAGYHGGAAPAEVVVPVVLLVPSGVDEERWRPAPYQAPSWWEGPAGSVAAPVVVEAPHVAQPDLFTEPEPASPFGLGAELVASSVFAEQRRLAGRVVVTDAAVSALIDALASAPSRRLTAGQAATVMGVPVTRAQLALGQVAKLVNVEGYPVLAIDPSTGAVVLDQRVLREQYGLASG